MAEEAGGRKKKGKNKTVDNRQYTRKKGKGKKIIMNDARL
jgi:hypothetical protein